MNKVFGILLALLNLVSSSSWGCNYLGEDYQSGVKAYNNGDFDIYVEKMTPCEKGGSIEHQAMICSTYLYRLQPPNYQEGLNWCTQAAQANSTSAQVHLSNIYFLGWGVPRDWEYAYMWSNIAASSGNETAKAHLRDIQKVMTKEAIINAQRLTRACVAKQYKDC